MTQRIAKIGGSPLTTLTKTAASDAVAQLSSAEVEDSTAGKVELCVVYVKTNDINYAFGTDPAAGGAGATLFAEQYLTLNSYAQVKDFRWCNATAGSNATVLFFREVLK